MNLDPLPSEVMDALRAAYPSGRVEDLSEVALQRPNRDERIRRAIHSIIDRSSLLVSEGYDWPPGQSLALTRAAHPTFEQWLCKNNSEKLAWIAENEEPYPVLWLNVSRVADIYKLHFNLWHPRGKSGYLDIDCPEAPGAEWRSQLKIVHDELERESFTHMTPEMYEATVAFVTVIPFWSVPEEGPRWDDDDFAPEPVPASLHLCLFGL